MWTCYPGQKYLPLGSAQCTGGSLCYYSKGLSILNIYQSTSKQGNGQTKEKHLKLSQDLQNAQESLHISKSWMTYTQYCTSLNSSHAGQIKKEEGSNQRFD